MPYPISNVRGVLDCSESLEMVTEKVRTVVKMSSLTQAYLCHEVIN